MTYRTNEPILGLTVNDDHQGAIAIRAGHIVNVIGPAEDSRFLLVDVDGQRFSVFASDLAERGKEVSPGASAREGARTKAAGSCRT